jgi:hypothetical protein
MKIKLYLIAILAGSCLLTPTAAKAQEQVEKRVDALEKIISRLPGISGLVSVRFQGFDMENPDSTAFDIRHARLDFKGGFSSFNYRLQLEMAGSPRVLDAFLTWKATPHLNVQAGQYKLPFSLENPLSPMALETIDNSQVINRLFGGRNIGVGVNGGFLGREGSPLITYNAGMFNVNASSHAFSGIVGVHPVKGLSFAGSYYLGEAAAFNVQGGAFSARYEANKWFLRAEFFHKTTENYKDQDGYYITGGSFVCRGLQVLAKYDRVDDDVNYTLGCNYSPVKNLRLMLNYTYKEREDGPSFFPRPAPHYVALQAMVTF